MSRPSVKKESHGQRWLELSAKEDQGPAKTVAPKAVEKEVSDISEYS